MAIPMELGFIVLVLSFIVLQAAFFALAPKTCLHLRNRILRTSERIPVSRGYGRERAVGMFILFRAAFLIYLIFGLATVDVGFPVR